MIWPDNDGAIPGESQRLLHPRRSCFAPAKARLRPRILVEAPGTAPGSERFIATSVYRHSRLAPAPRIYAIAGGEKRAVPAKGECIRKHGKISSFASTVVIGAC